MDDHILRYWIGFNRAQGIGPVRLRALIDHFGNIETAWKAPLGALKNAGLDQRSVDSLIRARNQTDLDAEMRTIQRLGLHIVPIDDPDYPLLLRSLYDAPPVLYIKGSLTEGDGRAIAVVGTRRATSYGKTITAELVTGLAQRGLTVISGLARGIDAVAHQAALAAGGRTIAVLANGLDQVYPPEHHALAEAIAAQGALISELPIGSPPERGHFVPRNRIISGLALGVLVVEASETSGALKTADLALDQGREVFAVPGNASSPTSRGTNALIRSGAKMVLDVDDILGEIDQSFLRTASLPEKRERGEQVPTRPTVRYVSDDPTEASLLRLLSSGPQEIDTLAHLTGLPIQQISSALTQ
ncbi:MAG TPA: DNA-processing protein DprA, partial [Aggregatilineales bacterium]|nr:DNA-processing protein DprA [Aggregatilineales bacterium]